MFIAVYLTSPPARFGRAARQSRVRPDKGRSSEPSKGDGSRRAINIRLLRSLKKQKTLRAVSIGSNGLLQSLYTLSWLRKISMVITRSIEDRSHFNSGKPMRLARSLNLASPRRESSGGLYKKPGIVALRVWKSFSNHTKAWFRSSSPR